MCLKCHANGEAIKRWSLAFHPGTIPSAGRFNSVPWPMSIRHTNILRTYHQASADEMQSGMTWYRSANEEADRLSVENNLTVAQTSAIIAAVSPGLRWERNVECAERIIKRESLKGLGVRWYDGVRKAKRVLKGHNPLEVLKGNKVRAFYACIANPSTTIGSVCIDGHAYAIWCGKRITLDDVPPLNDRLYNRIAGDYVEVARQLSIAPCQLQAVTWQTWRRIHEA